MATLGFSLPDEEDEFRAAVEGMRCRLVLLDLSSRLREVLKYGFDARKIPTAEAAYEDVRDLLFQLCDEHSIDLDW